MGFLRGGRENVFVHYALRDNIFMFKIFSHFSFLSFDRDRPAFKRREIFKLARKFNSHKNTLFSIEKIVFQNILFRSAKNTFRAKRVVCKTFQTQFTQLKSDRFRTFLKTMCVYLRTYFAYAFGKISHTHTHTLYTNMCFKSGKCTRILS